MTPPVYTGVAPIVLADGSEKVGAGAESFRALSVPERSELIVRTHAPQGETVSLTTSQDGVAEAKIIEPKTGGSEGLVEFTVPLTEPLSADVKISGQTVSKWRFELIKDEAPSINLMGTPTATPRGAFAWCSAPTTITAWPAPRPASRWAKARNAIWRRCLPRPPPSSTPIRCSSRR